MKSNHLVIGILADVDAGKTTLSENILYACGSIRKLGRVDHGDTCLDSDSMEIERGITIFSTQAEFSIGEKNFTLLDTPGHADFSAETERVLSVLDYAVLVISAPEGVRSHVHTLWRLLKRYEIPVFVFVNKTDLFRSDPQELIGRLNRELQTGFVSADLLNSEETAALDDILTEKYLDGEEIGDEDIRRIITERKLFPCYFGSALKNTGINEFLEGISRYTSLKEYSEEFGAKIFKITRDQGERLSHLKITGGRLKTKDTVGENKIEQIRLFSGNSSKSIHEADAGMIVSVLGLNDSYSGQGIGMEKDGELPELVPLFSMTVKSTFDISNAELYEKLKLLEEEIPEISVDPYSGKGDVRIRLMGDVQTEIISKLMEDRFGMKISFTSNRIVYRETVTAVSEGVGHFEPLRHYAEVHLKLEPGQKGSGMTYSSELSEDLLPGNYQRLILSQLENRWHKGVLTGSVLTDTHVTLIAGKHHVKHTVGGDFREAGCRALRQGLMKNKCKVLEPWYRFEITLPMENTGRAMSDITCRLYGEFEGPFELNGFSLLKGMAPVSTIQNYQSELTAYTKGYGKLSLQYAGYSDCHNEEEVIAEENYDAEADLRNPAGSVFCEHGAGMYVNWNEVEEHMHIPYVLSDSRGKNNETAPAIDQDKSGKTGRTSADYLGAGIREDKELERIFQESLGKNRKNKEERHSVPPVKKVFQTVPVPEPKKNFLLVDGYNIIHAWSELKEIAEKDFGSARTSLMEILANYQAFRGMTLILVFDAYRVPGNPGSIEKFHNIYVVYTKEAETADSYIEKTVHEIGRKHNVTVATNDGMEQIIIYGEGAVRQSSADLYKEILTCNTDIEEICFRKRQRLKNRIPVPSDWQKCDENQTSL